jgi:ferredoxin
MSGTAKTLQRIEEALSPHGIHLRGVVNFEAGEGPVLADGRHAAAILLLGNVSDSIWPPFSQWRKTYDDPDPLDAFSKAVILPLAKEMGATAYFPSDPPWQPFQQWAKRAEGMSASPLGILIHPEYGLWHGYRGALGFAEAIDVPQAATFHACDHCREKPCLTHCPAGAVTMAGFDVATCRDYLRSDAGQATCMVEGCRARNACPVGAEFRYSAEQLAFHMQALAL